MTTSRTSSPFAEQAYVWVIDQLGEDVVTVEVDGAGTKTVPRWVLPQDVKEGDVLQVRHDHREDRSVLMIVQDHDERLRRLTQSRAQVTSAKGAAGPSGDIVL